VDDDACRIDYRLETCLKPMVGPGYGSDGHLFKGRWRSSRERSVTSIS
jgi:hypothetical protein